MRTRAWATLMAVAVTVAVVAQRPDAAAAQSVVVGQRGYLGSSAVGAASCAYRVFGPNGVLAIGVPTPVVGGANPRPRRRSERTFVRFRVVVFNAADGSTAYGSGWSSWVRVTEWQTATWGDTYVNMDWRGVYGVDVRIEWWNRRRMLGWRGQRITAYQYYDQYGIGPIGPMAACAQGGYQYPLPDFPTEVVIDSLIEV